MYSYIIGTITERFSNYIVLENNGIGYKIFVTNKLSRYHFEPEAKIYLHQHVREDNISLYGFLSQTELDLFELLINVSGVGTKTALNILDTYTAEEIFKSISASDSKAFGNVSGVGPKTAIKIILELKDKLKIEEAESILKSADDTLYDDAVEALVALGYKKFDATKIIKKVAKPNMELQHIIKEALKHFAN